MSHDPDRAALRASWLSEVDVALCAAQQLTTRLYSARAEEVDLMMLSRRIMSARAIVKGLQRTRHDTSHRRTRSAPYQGS